MANKFIIPAAPVVGAAASANATLDMSLGPRHHVIWLKATFTASATAANNHIANVLGLIKVKLNGRTQRQFSAFQLNGIQSSYGANFRAFITTAAAQNVIIGYPHIAESASSAAATTALLYGSELATPAALTSGTSYTLHLPIFFAEPWRKQYAAVDAMAWPTSWPGGKSLIGTFQLEIACGSLLTALAADLEIDYQQRRGGCERQPHHANQQMESTHDALHGQR